MGHDAACAQENIAPNAMEGHMMARAADDPKRVAKRTKRTKRVARPATATETATEADSSAAAAPVGPTRADSPRAGKQQKLDVDTVQRCLGESRSENSPPLAQVQERFAAYAQHAKRHAVRGPSALASCVQQADGSGPREVDWLSRGVAVCTLSAANR
jgi:hypothetical protein